MHNKELAACTPIPVDRKGFNGKAEIPYGVTTAHVRQAMEEFIDFLAFVNSQLHTKKIDRLESFLIPANFSSMVGEFVGAAIPKYCKTVCRKLYHNGHPDILPKGRFEADCIQHGTEGIEIKGPRHGSGWQGHNAEEIWLMVFVFDANASRDKGQGKAPKPFKFIKVVGAQLANSDWQFSGRSATSRRTITASVKRSGFDKMEAN
jgi:hypothetical protein